MWATIGKIVDPPNGTLLADTGPSSPMTAAATLLITTDVAVVVTLQQRNAANDASVAEHEFSNFGNMIAIPFTITLSMNQRLRAIVAAAVIGNVQASIMW